jgi:hypothetical protein
MIKKRKKVRKSNWQANAFKATKVTVSKPLSSPL